MQHDTIVGSDLRLVEAVLRRMTTPHVAFADAASGAWLGVLIALLSNSRRRRGGWSCRSPPQSAR